MRCSATQDWINSATFLKSFKSEALIPRIVYLLKNGIIIFTMHKNFSTIKLASSFFV
jgi:hypothetical protein